MSQRDRPATLSNGLRVYGASRADARSEHFTSGYFRAEVEIRPGMVVLDLGANIGMFSLEALRRTGGGLQLFAFEPAPEPFAYLERNVRELFPRAEVQLCREAVGARAGQATLYYRPRLSPTSSLYAEPQGDPEALVEGFTREPPPGYAPVLAGRWRPLARPVVAAGLRLAGRWASARVVPTPCSVTTVSAVLQRFEISRVDFLKIDVEGAELDVLQGIEDGDWAKIHALAVEIHDRENRVERIRSLLHRAGFAWVHVEQEWPFQGTDVYTLFAARAMPGDNDPGTAAGAAVPVN
jgi:FkbM family methyltransferase